MIYEASEAINPIFRSFNGISDLYNCNLSRRFRGGPNICYLFKKGSKTGEILK